MVDSASLTNHFLIAMPQLLDPNFFHTVTYICEHNNDGAMGIVVNRPMDLRLGDVMEHLSIAGASAPIAALPVFQGGPVQREHGFVLHRPVGHWNATLGITDSIGVTTSRDVLEAIAREAGPQQSFIALGYAGWAPGQLDQEMAENAWLSGPADPEIIFGTPVEQRWEAAAALLGVDLRLLSGDVGHA